MSRSATISSAASSGVRRLSEIPRASAFSGEASARESSLSMPIPPRSGSASNRRATYSLLPLFGAIVSIAFPI